MLIFKIDVFVCLNRASVNIIVFIYFVLMI